MDIHPPEDGIPFLEWYRDLYEICVKCFEEFFEVFPIFDGYKKCLESVAKKGINSCDDEIVNYLTSSGMISHKFIKETLKRIEEVDEILGKIELQNNVALKAFNYGKSFGFFPN